MCGFYGENYGDNFDKENPKKENEEIKTYPVIAEDVVVSTVIIDLE